MNNVGLLSLEQFQKLPMDDKLNLAKNDFGLFLHMHAREDESNFLRNVKEVTKCSDEMAKKLLVAATRGEYTGFDPELKALSEKAARFVVTHEAGKKFMEWVKEEESEHKEGGLVRGSLVGLSHAKQVHALADHYEHGGSIADAARAMGMSEEQAKKVEKAEKEFKDKYDQEHKDELERINNIKNDAERKKALEEYNRMRLQATNDELYRQGLISAQIHATSDASIKLNEAKSKQSMSQGQSFDSSSKLNKAEISDAEKVKINKELIEIKAKMERGIAVPKDEAKWHIATIAQMPKERQAEYLESNPKAKGLIERYSVKNDDKTLNYLANTIEVSECKKSEVKSDEKEDEKNISVKNTTNVFNGNAWGLPKNTEEVKLSLLEKRKEVDSEQKSPPKQQVSV